MKFYFTGDIADIEPGINYFADLIRFDISDLGTEIIVIHCEEDISISCHSGTGQIKYRNRIHFFRALGLFIEAYSSEDEFDINEKAFFEMSGVMLDCSRNAVPLVSTIKHLILRMAVMGLDTMILYFEDTYSVPEYPYFGYMRGRYSSEELKECDEFAELFGIEIMPYIQILGHLEQALKWNYASQIRDTYDVILAGSDASYIMISDMISSVMKPLRTRKIGIGIDEAYSVGLGKYLEINGFRDKFEILNEHLMRVFEIISEYDLIAYVPSDMYLKLSIKSGYYFDAQNLAFQIPEQIISRAKFVYWDYYHENEEFYSDKFELHKKAGMDTSYCGGVSLWSGMAVNYRKTFAASVAGLQACKKAGIREVIVAMFGDDCSESNYFGGLLGMQLFAENTYNPKPESNHIADRFNFCTGGNMEAFFALGEIDEPYKDEENALFAKNPSKYMLYQDVLIGLFDKHLEGIELSAYYASLSLKMGSYAISNYQYGFLFNLMQKLCDVLELKADLGIKIKKLYDAGDFDALRVIVDDVIPILINRVEILRSTHYEQWMASYKPFGWEVLDIRYGGIIARLSTTKKRLDDLLDGKIDRIPEIEEKRLYFDDSVENKPNKICGCNDYKRIVTAGYY